VKSFQSKSALKNKYLKEAHNLVVEKINKIYDTGFKPVDNANTIIKSAHFLKNK